MNSPEARDANLGRYEDVTVVSHYERQEELQPCETHIFERYLKPGLAILDMGVGGGRTTPYLSRDAARYVGADYSNGMVEACRRRFPEKEFVQCDATNMEQFEDASFDMVVFSFNGIGYIPTDEARARCLSETVRVLKPGGLFVFSVHNARLLGLWPVLAGAKPHQVLWRSLLSTWKSVAINLRRAGTGIYGQGRGYFLDPVHGGLRTFVCVPETIRPEIDAAGMALLETVTGPNHTLTARALTPWYYYVCSKTATADAA